MPKTLSFLKNAKFYVYVENKSTVLEFMVLFSMVMKFKLRIELK